MQAVRSPLIGFGGKGGNNGADARFIINQMPEHSKYIEPFVGRCNILPYKSRVSHELINDIDGYLVNFLMVAREEPERLQIACETLPYSERLYKQWQHEEMPRDPFQQAVRFFFLNRSAIAKGNADPIPNTGWRNSTTSSQNPANGYQSACQLFVPFAQRLAGVMITCRDFREIIEKFDSQDALFYVDPPYVGREKFYAGNFTEKDHRDLADMLSQIEGKAIVSYYDDPLIRELYQADRWRWKTYDGSRQLPGIGRAADAEELLLMNWDDPQLTLWNYA